MIVDDFLYGQTVGFLNHLDAQCRDCLRKSHCADCALHGASSLLERHKIVIMDAKKTNEERGDTHNLRTRYHQITAVLRDSDKPLRARDIHVPAIQSKFVKWWTLRKMLTKGIIQSTVVTNFRGKPEVAFYVVKKGNTKHGNNKHRA